MYTKQKYLFLHMLNYCMDNIINITYIGYIEEIM